MKRAALVERPFSFSVAHHRMVSSQEPLQIRGLPPIAGSDNLPSTNEALHPCFLHLRSTRHRRMNDWSVVTTRKPRGFIVTDPAGRTIATLRFPTWFAQRAEATLPSGTLDIRRRTWWAATYEARMNGLIVCTVAQKWAAMRLSLASDHAAGIELWLSRKGWLKPRYELSVPQGPTLLSFEPRPGFMWEMDMTVRIVGAGIAEDQLPLIITMAAFTARLMRSRTGAATSAG